MTRVGPLGVAIVFAAACSDPSSSTPTPDATSSGGPTQITFTNQLFDGTNAPAALVAYQDGDGPWQAASGEAGVYGFPVSSDRYGVLAVCADGAGDAQVSIGYYAVAEGAARVHRDGCAQPKPVTIATNIQNVSPTDWLYLSDGIEGATVGRGLYSIRAIPGPGSLTAISNDGSRMLILPAVFAEGAAFDVDFAAHFAAAEADVTLDLGDDSYQMTTGYIDAGGAPHLLESTGSGRPATPTRYHVAPVDRLQGGLSSLSERATTGASERRIVRYFVTPAAQALTLPPKLQLAAAPRLVASTPYAIVEATLPPRDGASFFSVTYAPAAPGGPSLSWTILYSAAWVGGTGEPLTSRIPDLSQLPGWQPAFGLPGAGPVDWTASVVTSSRRSSDTLADGDEVSYAKVSGTLE